MKKFCFSEIKRSFKTLLKATRLSILLQSFEFDCETKWTLRGPQNPANQLWQVLQLRIQNTGKPEQSRFLLNVGNCAISARKRKYRDQNEVGSNAKRRAANCFQRCSLWQQQRTVLVWGPTWSGRNHSNSDQRSEMELRPVQGTIQRFILFKKTLFLPFLLSFCRCWRRKSRL